jgi:hypothetical protein
LLAILGMAYVFGVMLFAWYEIDKHTYDDIESRTFEPE